jgi:hypothetical protein
MHLDSSVQQSSDPVVKEFVFFIGKLENAVVTLLNSTDLRL